MEALRQEWNHLYREKLPSLAKQRDAAQKKWPVTLDHCFARIILDNAVGKSAPWADVVKAPAVKNMSEEQINAALKLGNQICSGEADLVALDQRSLDLRGKTKYGGAKRKVKEENDDQRDQKTPRRSESHMSAKQQGGIEKYIKSESKQDSGSRVTSKASTTPTSKNATASDNGNNAAHPSSTHLHDLHSRIRSDRSLSTYRQNVLILLTEVPPGRFTNYKAMADGYTTVYGNGVATNARAIGSAMRNNPFAPAVPCHRVIAANGRIGGFGGEWGEEGKFAKEKRKLLRDEGIKFDGKGIAVGSPFTAFYEPKS